MSPRCLAFAAIIGVFLARIAPSAAGPAASPRGESKEIAGVVRWPDGKPARGARVFANVNEFDDLLASLPFHPNADETDGSGAFRIRDLEGDARLLRATIDGPEKPTSASSVQLPWTAEEEHVKRGRRDVVLVLEPGSTLRGIAVDDRRQPLRRFTVESRLVNRMVDGRAMGWAPNTYEIKSHDGTFEIRGLHRGSWEIDVDAAGTLVSKALQVTLPAEIPPHEFVAPRASVIRGVVVDAHGAPVAGANVKLRAPDERGGARFETDPALAALGVHFEGDDAKPERRSRDNPHCRTDESGRFDLLWARPGRQVLRAWAPGHATSVARVLDLTPGTELEDFRVALRRGATIRGVVRDPQGQPLAGIDVGAIFDNESVWQTTGNDGAYRFEHVGPGDVLLAAREDLAPNQRGRLDPEVIETRVTVREDSDIEVALGGKPSSTRIRVTGVVRGALDVANAKVRFDPERDGADHVQVRTDAQGRYSLELTERGVHWVTLHLSSDSLAERNVSIGDEDEYVIDLDLPGTLLRGRVVHADRGAVVATVRLRRTDLESSRGGWSTVATDQCAKDGTFVFEGLDRGPWRMSVRPKSGTPEAGVLAPQHFLVDLTTTKSIEDFVVRLDRGGAIEGVVRGSDGKPLAGARVTARGEDGFDFDHETAAEERCATDAAGRYELHGLCAGTWQVRAVADRLASRESPVLRLEAGGRASADLALEPAGFVDVKLEDAEGVTRKHGPGEWTRVYDETGRAWHDLEEERFGDLVRTYGPLPPGTWAVRRGDGSAYPQAVVDVRAGETHVVVLREKR